MAQDDKATTTTAAPAAAKPTAPAADPVIVMSSQEIKGQRIAETKAAAADSDLFVSDEGGKYAVEDDKTGKVLYYVDANGNQIDE